MSVLWKIPAKQQPSALFFMLPAIFMARLLLALKLKLDLVDLLKQ